MPERDYQGRRGQTKPEQVQTKQPRSSAAPQTAAEIYKANESGQSATDSFMDTAVVWLAWTLAVATCPIALPAGINIVKEYERAVIYRNGRVKGKQAAGPGLFCVLERMLLVDDI